MLDYPISFYGINGEMGLAAGTAISLTDANVRRLANKPSGSVSFSDLVGVQEYTLTVGKHSTLDGYGSCSGISGGDFYTTAFGSHGLSSNLGSKVWTNGWGVRSLTSEWSGGPGSTALVLTMPPGQVPTFSTISVGTLTFSSASTVEQAVLSNGDAYLYRWNGLLVTPNGSSQPSVGSQLRVTLRR
ncbi:hypothetical protein [Cupriavidus necator]